jgi:hypothetical protein
MATDPLREMRDFDQARLETLASTGNSNLQTRGAARAELDLRDREYDEQQEAERRQWEVDREHSRRIFELNLADKQLRAASDVAWATKWAMVAAIAAALGALIQAAVAVLTWIGAK